MINIEPATTRLAGLVLGVPEERLGSLTPFDCTVGELLDHIQSFAVAFRAAAEKVEDGASAGPPPTPSAAFLGNDWRDRIPWLLSGLIYYVGPPVGVAGNDEGRWPRDAR